MNPSLTKIYLVGSLGRAIGLSEVELDVKSPGEAIRALDINLKGALSRYLTGPAKDKPYKIAVQKRANIIDPKEINNRSGNSAIYIMPTIRGRDDGFKKIITGALLIVAALVTQQYWLITQGPALFAVHAVIGFGISMVLGGIVQLLTPTPQGPTTSPEQAQSTSFPGTTAAVTQGGCVPVVYGRALVSPIPVSVTTTNNDVSTSAAGTLGTVDDTSLEGGGTQYSPG